MGNPGFSIQIDYRFANNAVSDRDQQIIAEAARIWETLIADDFEDIAADTTTTVFNPSTDVLETITFTEAVDDLIIFVGAQSLNPNTLAFAGPEFDDVSNRYNGPDFEPDIGTLTINVNSTLTLDTALHEIGHVLGISTAPAFENLIDNTESFNGPTARAVNNGNPIPLLSAADGHIAQEFQLANGLIPLLIPFEGASGLPTLADLAILADIGYEIPSLAGVTAGGPLPVLNYTLQGTDGNDGLNPARVEEVAGGVIIPQNMPLSGFDGADIILGGAGDDAIMGAYIHLNNLDRDGADQIDGGTGNDSIQGGGGNDLIIGGAGDDDLYGEGEEGNFYTIDGEETTVDYSPTSKDTFGFDLGSGTDTIHDFGVDYDVIQVDPDYGIATPADLLASVVFDQSLPNGFTQSTLELSPGNVITIVHDKPLTEANFKIETVPTLTLSEPETNPTDPTDPTNPSNPTNPSDPTDPSNPTDPTDEIVINRIKGSNRADRIFGADNVIDRIAAGKGNDRVKAGSGGDRINGGGGNDKLFGQADDDVLIGGQGRDRLVGGDGNDTLRGGGGNDKLDGGLGDDLVIGGGGRDRIFLRADDGVDTIKGFRLNQDQLRFKGIRSTQVDFIQEGKDTLLQLNGDDLAIVKRTDASEMADLFG